MNVIGIVAGGPKEGLPPLHNYPIDLWIGADRGALRLCEQDISPDLSIGDFDSVNDTELKRIESKSKHITYYQQEKDETDLELAIENAIKFNPRCIYIFGATGGRMDHEISHILLLKSITDQGIDAWICNEQNEITVKSPGHHQLVRDDSFKYVSFIPLSPVVSDITIKGFLYELVDHELHWGSTLTVSNEWKEKIGTYLFSEGILIVVKSRD
ncbi:thiamine diphosphokinase [Alkalibacillus aidingensis]|uniref:thiamine diphosphokinase n=1 Tax=Alkalibacillus aidingensis TaxID=2747607 RepID=UPI00166143B4|nr:thiamine diphosphokinase [Alkalibacillus aidingensis]